MDDELAGCEGTSVGGGNYYAVKISRSMASLFSNEGVDDDEVEVEDVELPPLFDS
eukprot:CAMPEP_0113953784 /NCGR_PEP_ID=MMETSP0011_2-20120614/39_1 /TAXON_ID=101924 /ORGANISM="Rhodosorus marinus" /LENGTH=54 /DNA_ID=CAMNT_0000962539 /DNA_START=358 /DNA_END=522 /DNA_ORIENTATION=+ /assembly_acc=CAM_ASM_000156